MTDSRRPIISAVVGCGALAVYAALKAVWDVGGEISVRDAGEWQAMLDSLTPAQLFGAFWGTVLLDGCGGALLLLLAWPHPNWTSRWWPIARGLGWLTGAGLTLVGVAGLAVALGPLTELWTEAPGDSGPLADWVFIVVYGAFWVVGLAFLITTASTRSTADPMTAYRPRAPNDAPQ